MKNLMIIFVLLISIASNAQQVLDEYTAVESHISRKNVEWPNNLILNSDTITVKWEEQTEQASANLETRSLNGIRHLYMFNNGLKEGSIIYVEMIIVPNDMKQHIKDNLEYMNQYEKDDKGYRFYYKDGVKIRVTHQVEDKDNLFVFGIYD